MRTDKSHPMKRQGTTLFFFLFYQSRSFPYLLLNIKPDNLSPWGCNLLLSLDTRFKEQTDMS